MCLLWTGDLPAATTLQARYLENARAFLAQPGADCNSFVMNWLCYGTYSSVIGMADSHFRPEESRVFAMKALNTHRQVALPDVPFSFEHVARDLRVMWADIGLHQFTRELGEDAVTASRATFTIGAAALSLQAALLLYETTDRERQELATTGGFAPPDPLELALNIGICDGLQSMGLGCVHSRVAEALTLLGHTELALAFTTHDALGTVLRFDQRVACALVRAQALSARGDAGAATAAFEAVAAESKTRGMVLWEVRALHGKASCADAPDTAGLERTRLGAALRSMVGRPDELTALFQDRNLRPTRMLNTRGGLVF